MKTFKFSLVLRSYSLSTCLDCYVCYYTRRWYTDIDSSLNKIIKKTTKKQKTNKKKKTKKKKQKKKTNKQKTRRLIWV